MENRTKLLGIVPCIHCNSDFNVSLEHTPMCFYSVKCSRCDRKTKWYANPDEAIAEWNQENKGVDIR